MKADPSVTEFLNSIRAMENGKDQFRAETEVENADSDTSDEHTKKLHTVISEEYA